MPRMHRADVVSNDDLYEIADKLIDEGHDEELVMDILYFIDDYVDCDNDTYEEAEKEFREAIKYKESEASECSSAAALGEGPDAAVKKSEDAEDDFLYNALDDARLCDGKVVVKFCADAGEFELIALYKGDKISLKSGSLFEVVDFYREFLDWDESDIISYLEQEA